MIIIDFKDGTLMFPLTQYRGYLYWHPTSPTEPVLPEGGDIHLEQQDVPAAE